MSNPVINTEALHVDAEAAEWHDIGVEAALAGDFKLADEAFTTSLSHIEDEPTSYDAKVQVARIGRDVGFTGVRKAIERNDVRLLARSGVQISHYSGPFIEAFTQGQNCLTKKARRESLAEYGATVSLLGRTATVTQVMRENTGAVSVKIRQAANSGKEQYAQAHNLLRQGDNGYYRVSNALTAARHERMNGRILKAAGWVGRATVGLAWTAANDRQNFGAAVRTAGNRARHLLTRGTARRSVKKAP